MTTRLAALSRYVPPPPLSSSSSESSPSSSESPPTSKKDVALLNTTMQTTMSKDEAIIERNRRLLAQRQDGGGSSAVDNSPKQQKKRRNFVSNISASAPVAADLPPLEVSIPNLNASEGIGLGLGMSSPTNNEKKGRFKRPKSKKPFVPLDQPELFGRDGDRDALLQAYETRHKRHLVLLVGQPGNGKSSLASTLRNKVTQSDDGYFLTGRFDPLGRPEPFGPFVAAVAQFVQQTRMKCQMMIKNGGNGPSSSSSDPVSRIRNALLRVMDLSELQALSAILPSLKDLLGDLLGPNAAAVSSGSTVASSDAASVAASVAVSVASGTSSASANTVGGGGSHQHSRSSFLVTFCNLMRAVAHPDHPIVLFLDDLQSADAGSLEVLKILVADPKIQGLFCAVAFRPVGVRHPCSLLLHSLESSGVPFVPILPSPLPADAIATWMRYGTDLVRDMVVRPGDHMERACQAVADGTQGNALAVLLSLKAMSRTDDKTATGGGDVKRQFGLLFSSLSPSCQTTLSVAACMGRLVLDSKVLKELLPAEDLERDLKEAESAGVLKYVPADCGMTSYVDEDLGFVGGENAAASLELFRGPAVRRRTASSVTSSTTSSSLGTSMSGEKKKKKDKKKNKKDKKTASNWEQQEREQQQQQQQEDNDQFVISEALKDCIVADEHVDDYYAMPALNENKRDSESGRYVFANSTFKDCIFNLLTPTDRRAYHLAVGKVLLQDVKSAGIYRAVSQLQLCAEQLSPRGKETLARLCLKAGQDTSDWTEFTAATKYLDLGIDLLMDGAAKWKQQYDLSLALYRASADVYSCTGNFDAMDKRLIEILDHATGSADKLKAYIIQMQSLSGRTMHADAIQLGLKVLPKLNEPISLKKSNGTLLTESDEKVVKKLLEAARQDPSTVWNAPLMSDRKKLGAMHIMNLLVASAFLTQGELVPLVACRMVKLTLQHGLTGASAVGLAVHGAALCAAGDVEQGSFCSDLALTVLDKLDEKTWKGRVMAIYWGIQGRFQKPWKQCQEPLKVSYRLCMEGGDNEFALISPIMSILNMLVAGGPLNSVAEAMKSVYQLLYKKNQDNMMRIIRPFFQEVLNLMGATLETNPLILSGNIMNEEEELRYAQETSNNKVIFCIYLCQAELAFYLHKFKRAKELITQCKEIGPPEMIVSSLAIKLTFLDVMTSIAIAWDASRDRRKGPKEALKRKRKYVAAAKEAAEALEELAKFAPSNLLQKIYMIEAEFAALDGNVDGAMDLFKKSMNHAEQHGAMADRTLACERAGLALRCCGKEDDALDYLEDCCGYYRAWGALVKVNHVKGNVIPQAIFEWDE